MESAGTFYHKIVTIRDIWDGVQPYCMGYRSRAEIVHAVLRSAGSGNTKTRIMQDACLTYIQIMQYLPSLERRGMIGRGEDNRYRLTRRGRRALEAFESRDDGAILGISRILRTLC